MNQWCKYELRDLHDDKERAEICGVSTEEVRKDVLAIVLSDKLEVAREESTKSTRVFCLIFSFQKKERGH